MASKDDLDAVKNKIPNVSGFLLTSVFNSKTTEVENKIPDIKNLASKAELNAVENKIPNTSNLVTKTEYATEISRIKKLVQKTTFESELKNVDDKVVKNNSDILSYESRLKQKEDTVHGLERGASYLRGKNYFGEDGKQNYLVFQLMYEYLKRVVVTANNVTTIYVHSWTSKGISNEQIKAPGTSSSNDQAPVFNFSIKGGISLKFTGDFLRPSRVTYNHGPEVSVFIVYRLDSHTINLILL